MSRELLRAAKKAARRQKPQRNGYQVQRNRPRLDERWRVFGHIYAIFDKLDTGTVDAIDGKPIFNNGQGEYCYMVPSLRGWCELWRSMSERLQFELDVGPLLQLANQLHYRMPLTPGITDRARAVVDRCAEIHRQLDPAIVKSFVTTQCIALEFESLKERNGQETASYPAVEI